MSALFTQQLRDVMANHDIGLIDYPIFDEGYRLPLNKKITDHYRFREIGTETVDMFIFMLNRRMNEIMPLYNQLYESANIGVDFMHTIDMYNLSQGVQTQKQDNQAESTSTSDVRNTSRAVSSVTPQTQLAGDGDYADGLQDTSGDTHSGTTGRESAKGSVQGDSRQTGRTVGRTGSAAGLLSEWRATMLNIDMMVIGDLSDLFFGLWDHSSIPNSSINYYVPGVAFGIGYYNY